MKKITVFIASLILAITANSQSMFEDFESYSVGDYMGVVSADWSTWSGTTGGAEDVQVINTEASSGSQSIYFSSTSSTGGPQDVIVDFGGEYNTGDFVFETDMYVEGGKGAYFNFQANSTVGEIWALNVQCVQDGNMYIDDGFELLMTTAYPSDTWFTLTIDINLNTNDWEVFIDGTSQGVVQNEVNQVASLDIFPVNSNYGGNDLSAYYMDDVEFTHTPYALPTLNGGVTQITDLNGLSSQTIQPTVKVRNLGTTTITSFDLEITYDGATINESVTGVSISSLDTYEVPFTDELTLAPGSNDVVATISNVNGGGADDDAADDSKTVTLDPVVPAVGKVVVGEEATGTWCGWCPRGAVFMDMMEDNYADFWAGIAVHNGDPMVVDDYDAAIGGYIGGYPSGLVDRGTEIDPSGFEGEFLTQVQLAPTATMTPGAFYNAVAGELYVSVTTEFQTSATGTDFNLALVMTEDSVTGTGSGYAQTNYYAGGGSGEMGGYELLPDPVPAADMVYDHVAREILPGWDGESGIFPASVSASETFTHNFIVSIDSEWDISKMHIIPLLINNTTDEIDNAGKATVDEAIDNGYVGLEEGTPTTNVKLFPNPTTDHAKIEIGEVNGENVSMHITDLNGKVVTERNYGQLEGNLLLPVNVEQMKAGVYLVRLTVGTEITMKKLVVE